MAEKKPITPTAIALVAIPCATLATVYAMSIGLNGYLFGIYMVFLGGVCGVPLGYKIARKKA